MVEGKVENYYWAKYDFSGRRILVLDTALRDGEQSGVIRIPTVEEEIEYVRRAVELGIDAIDLTTPMSRGPKLKRAIAVGRTIPPWVDVVCLARTREKDIQAALDLQQGIGRQIKGIIFVGSSNKRLDAEEWNLGDITRWMGDSVSIAYREQIVPIVATEHTTETDGTVVSQIFRAGLQSGGMEVCIADTTGVATTEGTRKLVRFMKDVVLEGYDGKLIHWHGHDDYGLSVANTLAALDEGANCVHVTPLGIGERSGNAPLETVLLNLKRFGDPKRQNLLALLEFMKYSSLIFDEPIRRNYPGVGENNRKYASGIHASAMRKARISGKPNPYESVPQEWFGLNVEAVVGPVSGEANVLEVLDSLCIVPTQSMVDFLLETAIRLNRILTKEEVFSIAQSMSEGNSNRHGHG